MKIFLIAGKAGCGKNEVANIIKEKLGKTVITGFSKYIKLFALELTDWDGRDFSKPREYLQNMGDKLRAIDEEFLTKRILEDILVYENEGIENIVISDVRLVHEIEYFKEKEEYDVISVRVNCNSCIRDLTENERNHHTELELDDYQGFDYIIENKFDDDLIKDVEKILEGMK